MAEGDSDTGASLQLGDSDTGASLQLEAKEALLPRSDQIREAVCGQNGLLAWACLSTFLVFVFGITLVRRVS